MSSAIPSTDTDQIDAHHHLWRYNPQEFDWLDGPLEGLRRDFLGADLTVAMTEAEVDGTVAVQARQSLAETAWLLEMAGQTPAIRGVVGWAPIAADDFAETLSGLIERPALKGLRHVVQGEPDPEFLLGANFNRGIRLLRGTGLVYDLLILERQLETAIRFVDLHPDQVFVLDHLAKPRIAVDELEPWSRNLRALAERGNVFCKVSGMVTEADPAGWTSAQFAPYLGVAVEAFGPSRLLAGSDWPVCLAGCGYAQWFGVLRSFFKDYTATEQADIFGANAVRVYHLNASLEEQTPC